MSYSFDVAQRARAAMEPDIKDDVLKTRFRLLLESMHDANHKVDDAINRDSQVRRQAAAIDKYLDERKT